MPANSSTDCRKTAMESLTDSALVVFAWGNVSRGDDGIGPRMAGYLQEFAHPRIEVIEDHQLNIEHVTDVREGAPVLFIDASVALEQGYRLERLMPSDDGNFSTHAISPAALLNVYCQTMERTAPDAFLLHVAGKHFGLGDDLSPESKASIAAAWGFLKELLGYPSAEWTSQFAKAAAEQ
jgi:hydrogenase maturation protease